MVRKGLAGGTRLNNYIRSVLDADAILHVVRKTC